MEKNQSQKNHQGKLIFDNDKFSAWGVDEKEKSSSPGGIMEIHFETEIMMESRVYCLKNDINIKILSKQNKKSGNIESVILKQDIDGNKTILSRTMFADENIYFRSINDFEKLLPFSSKLVTSKDEYAQSLGQIVKKECEHSFVPDDNEGPYGYESCRFCQQKRHN